MLSVSLHDARLIWSYLIPSTCPPDFNPFEVAGPVGFLVEVGTLIWPAERRICSSGHDRALQPDDRPHSTPTLTATGPSPLIDGRPDGWMFTARVVDERERDRNRAGKQTKDGLTNSGRCSLQWPATVWARRLIQARRAQIQRQTRAPYDCCTGCGRLCAPH